MSKAIKELIVFDDLHVLEKAQHEFYLGHPKSCQNRGTAADRYKTFIGVHVLNDELFECGISPTEQDQEIIDRAAREIRKNLNNYFKKTGSKKGRAK